MELSGRTITQTIMKRLLLLPILFILVTTIVSAQDTMVPLNKAKRNTFISVELGQIYYRDHVSDPEGIFLSNQFNGPVFGIYLEQELNGKLSIEAGVRFRNHQTQIINECSGFTTERKVFQIPLRINYTLWQRGRFQVKTFAGINASSRLPEGASSDSEGELSYHYLTDNPAISMAPEVGVKVDYRVSPRMRIGMFASYVMSLSDLEPTTIRYSIEGNAPVRAISRNQSNYFQVGFRISYLLR